MTRKKRRVRIRQECQRLRDELDDLRQECERLQLAIQQQTQKDQETEAGCRKNWTASATSCMRNSVWQAIAAATWRRNSNSVVSSYSMFRRSWRPCNARGTNSSPSGSRTRNNGTRSWRQREHKARLFSAKSRRCGSRRREAAARAADHEVSPPAAGDNAADIATWKDVAEGLRRELQQTRDEHRRVREEWHVDRQNLERELNAHSTAAQQLEQKYKQDMREAEVLIHAMQQEGKHLLIQLDEAKQSIRQGTEGNKKKRPSLVHTVRSLVVDAAGPLTPQMPDNPPADQPPVALSEKPDIGSHSPPVRRC